jgi:hypothetical protein
MFTLLLIVLMGLFITYGYYNISKLSVRYVIIISLIRSILASILKSFTLAKLTAAFISLGLILLLRYTIAGGFYTNPLNIEEGLKIGIPAIILRIGIQGIIDYIFEDLGLRIWIEYIWNGPKDKGKMVIGHNYSFEGEKKPTNYLYLTAQSDNGGEGPSNYQDNQASPASSPSPPPSSINRKKIKKLYKFIEEYGSDTTVSTVESSIDDRKKTKEELVEDVKRLQDIIIDRKRATHQYTLELEMYKEARTALKKAVEDRTTEDLDAIQRVLDSGCDDPTLENVRKNIKNTSMLKKRSIDKAYLAGEKALGAVYHFELNDLIFKPGSSAITESTDVEKSDNINKRKLDLDDDNDNDNSKQTRFKESNNKKN